MKCSDTKFYNLKHGGLIYKGIYGRFEFIVAVFLGVKRVIGSPYKCRIETIKH